MPPSRLLDLPNELVDMIVATLDPTNTANIHALYNLCLVSQALYKIAQPVLFSSFNAIAFEDQTSEISHSTRMALYIRTLDKRGDLAKNTKFICLSGREEYEGQIDEIYKVQVDAEFLDDVIRTNPDRQLWRQKLRYFQFLTYSAILMSQLPNLRRLNLVRLSHKEGINLFAQDRLLSPHHTDMFAKIQEINIDGLINVGYYVLNEERIHFYNVEQLATYAAFLTLPALRIFRMRHLAALLMGRHFPFHSHSWPVEEIHLNECDGMSKDFLHELLKRVGALKAFTFAFLRHSDGLSHNAQFSPNECIQVLSTHHQDILSSLDLDMSSCDFYSDPDVVPTQQAGLSFGDLSSFTGLSYLAVDLFCMEKFPRLPPNLETLVLRNVSPFKPFALDVESKILYLLKWRPKCMLRRLFLLVTREQKHWSTCFNIGGVYAETKQHEPYFHFSGLGYKLYVCFMFEDEPGEPRFDIFNEQISELIEKEQEN